MNKTILKLISITLTTLAVTCFLFSISFIWLSIFWPYTLPIENPILKNIYFFAFINSLWLSPVLSLILFFARKRIPFGVWAFWIALASFIIIITSFVIFEGKGALE
ncbi:hypothetical protein NIASO_03335 [Niabella soli DSM 19437]|uniref:Uncharacterized protein n=1 Tax=Niabella soli DSM 19437 TaxID=929713 RepID=W0F6Y4_9BACT|nr:hypothetical protein NIASO_03335 [Niabella soli DSM 19437]